MRNSMVQNGDYTELSKAPKAAKVEMLGLQRDRKNGDDALAWSGISWCFVIDYGNC